MTRSYEINKNFHLLYCKLLDSCGFKFKMNAFYRCHADEVLLIISNKKRFPYFEVTFNVLPFSCAYTGNKEFQGYGIDWFMANRAKRLGNTYQRSSQDTFEKLNLRMYNAFSSVILPELNKVHSLDTFFIFEEWFTASVGKLAESVSDSWVYLQNKDYATAYNCIRKYLNNNANHYNDQISTCKTTFFTKEYNLMSDIAEKIDRQQYTDVDALTQNRIAITHNTCKHLGIL